MREEELRAAAKCALCDKPFGHTGMPLFWRVKLTRYGLDAGAIKRQSGLELMLGGAASLASVMGLNEVMAKEIFTTEITVCENCATEKTHCVAVLAEIGGREKD